MNNYYKKYIKYKNKYIKYKSQFGGIIDNILINKLDEQLPTYAIPSKLKKLITLITIQNSEVIRVGSSILKIQPYFSDVDICNIVDRNLSVDQTINDFILNLKKIITSIKYYNNIFFSDFKAGGLHWSIDEILNEQKNNVHLKDACKIREVIKLDIIVPYNERYIEMSSFYMLRSNGKDINNPLSDYIKSLEGDIIKYKDTKIFKAIKRVWSLSIFKKDYNTLNSLKKLIKSNIALLAQINADIETLQLLIVHNNNYNLEFVINELNQFKEKLSHIIDIDFNEEFMYAIIDNLILLFRINDKNQITESLNRVHDHLLKVINKETYDYLKSINYNFATII